MKAEYQYLVAKLQRALAEDPRVNVLDIKVMMVAEKIHLTGQVANEEHKMAATKVALLVLPDLEIRNELTVLSVGAPAQPEAIID
jgi:hypothetical protein